MNVLMREFRRHFPEHVALPPDQKYWHVHGRVICVNDGYIPRVRSVLRLAHVICDLRGAAGTDKCAAYPDLDPDQAISALDVTAHYRALPHYVEVRALWYSLPARGW